MNRKAALLEHRTGDVGRKEAHAGQVNRNVDARIFVQRGVQGECLGLRQRHPRDIEGSDRGDDNMPLGVYL